MDGCGPPGTPGCAPPQPRASLGPVPVASRPCSAPPWAGGRREGGPCGLCPPGTGAESCRPGLAGGETEAREVGTLSPGAPSDGFSGTAGERGVERQTSPVQEFRHRHGGGRVTRRRRLEGCVDKPRTRGSPVTSGAGREAGPEPAVEPALPTPGPRPPGPQTDRVCLRPECGAVSRSPGTAPPPVTSDPPPVDL